MFSHHSRRSSGRLVKNILSSQRKSVRLIQTSPMSTQTRPTGWKEAAPFLGPAEGNTTFDTQSKLQKLPVPDLPSTLAKLKQSLKPFARNDEEYASAVKKINAFASGEGPKLQEKLKRRAEQTDHWLEEWWDDNGYLGYRDSVIINVSYYYGFENQPFHLDQSAAARAACLARSGMLFRQKLREGKITPEGTKAGQLCMDTYRWMFDCCRVPGSDGLDWSATYAKADESVTGHIVVIRKNRVWKIDATKEGRILSTSEFETQMRHIYDNSSGDYPGIGVLTANNRDVWAKDYATLVSSSQNAEILEAIHSSAFVISLEESQQTSKFAHDGPSTPEAFSRALWHGDISSDGKPIGLRNRWVDKPIHLLVYDNASAGLLGEHSLMDGTPPQRFCDDVLEALRNPGFDHGENSSSTLPPKPMPLDWEVVPGLTDAIARADVAAVELIESQALGYLRTSYGKAAIKSFGVSPDSWAQMLVQLAYRRLLASEGKERKGGTYEAATTRKFLKGRTEAIRVVSSESDAWAKSMDDSSATNQQRQELFGQASKTHIGLAKEAGAAQGIDRHLFGLKMLLDPSGTVPEMFSDPVFKRSSYWVLSTSAINSVYFPVYGWGEVVPDGFGVPYVTGYDDFLQFTITSRAEMPNAKFCDEILKAADDMYQLFQSKKSKL